LELGTLPLGERRLELVPLETLVQAAQARVQNEATVENTEFSALNHRGVVVPLQVVAEDFSSLNVRVRLDCPLPDPLLPEVDLP
jgi:hypothetical protein